MFAGSDLSNNVVPDPTAYAQVNMANDVYRAFLDTMHEREKGIDRRGEESLSLLYARNHICVKSNLTIQV